ncbi:hypothetical protein GGQ88_003215 [Novosphingobium hassiacum]|uniref:Rap1a immunity protein domain-containing protein n=1 Tax=Novosphingobium hassiacum TaxID=173676 RepID=A0A7W5ZXQ8_9SPHN|nr:Rap1a/Tai family immunity protein [Novosphingobium hassiacum]MBB3861925.1 hypothetical protein [Novosphingobium hassiacum]
MPAIRSILVLATGLALSTVPARAEWMSGNQLHDTCSSGTAVDKALCLSYVMGVLDGSRFLDQPFKTPTGATGGQVRDVVAKYLEDHPETRDQPARTLVKAAVIGAWPKLQPKAAAKPPAKPKPKPTKKRS